MVRNKWSIPNIIIVACLLSVIVMTLYPFVYMIAVSLSKDIYVMKGEVGLWPKGLNFKMYEIVLSDPRIGKAYLNTFIYTVAGTVLSLVFTAMGAYAISKKEMIFHKTFTVMIVFTMFFSGGMIPTFLVVKNLGIVDTMWGMIFPTVISTWNLIIMRTFFANIPKELEESGRIDGLNDLGIFARIVIPLSKASLATIGLFYAVGMWNNFYSALLYLRSPELFPLQVVLRNIVLAGQVASSDITSVGGDQLVVEESLKFATIIVSSVPILLLYPFLQKYFVKGVMIGSVKG
ncbi:MAG: sugar transporter permease [Paenibacillus sp.]|nr:sugar transporter permease [Paenibacillus sp.]